MSRSICVVTGSRAEYGLLSTLMRAIKADPDLRLQIVATGMHLSPEFGLTWKEIEADGFKIDRKVEMLLSSDTAVGISKSMSLGLAGFAEVFADLHPDLIVLLGDRFETLSAAAAALIAKVPVAHLHGGEATEGAYDDSIRHAVTKMSHLHFTSTEAHRARVVQMGERPENVHNVGAIGLDAIAGLKLMDRSALAKDLGLAWKNRNLLITFHPATLDDEDPGIQFQALLDALDALPDTLLIFTKANADSNGRVINRMIDAYSASHADKAKPFASLGQLRYLSALKQVDAVVGNSSSGILEAPSFGIPTIDIGDRQKGRIRSASVIGCSPDAASISQALAQAGSEGFRKGLTGLANPYGDGKTTGRILAILKTRDLTRLLRKGFHDLPQASA